MALLDDGAWKGKIWTGAWTEGSGVWALQPAEKLSRHVVAVDYGIKLNRPLFSSNLGGRLTSMVAAKSG